MPLTFPLFVAGLVLAWLAPLLLLVLVVGLWLPARRQFCGNALIAGAVGSVMITTLWLFLVLLVASSLANMDALMWLGLCGAGFSIGVLLFAAFQKWQPKTTK